MSVGFPELPRCGAHPPQRVVDLNLATGNEGCDAVAGHQDAHTTIGASGGRIMWPPWEDTPLEHRLAAAEARITELVGELARLRRLVESRSQEREGE